MVRWVVMAALLALLAVWAAPATALAGGASNQQSLQPQAEEAVGVDAAMEEEAVDDSVESASMEVSNAALDEVEREWLSPADVAFLETADAAAAEDADFEADDSDADADADAEDGDADAEESDADAEAEGVSLSELGAGASKDKAKAKAKGKKKGPAKPYVVPCDFSAKRGICLFDGKKVIVPDAMPSGLVGHYSFNDHHAIDSSRYGNHGAKKTVAVPGRGGAGFAASFNGKNKLEIPHSKSLGALNEFSVSFWLYFPDALDPKQPTDCPILAKGTGNDQKLFSITVDARTRTLTFNSLSNGGSVSSRARIGPHRWTHVTAVRSSNTLSLFLHGVLDNTKQSRGGLQEPPSPLYVGRVPWGNKDCRVSFFIDDLRIYARALGRAEIEAESFPSLGAIEPSYAHLGCLPSCGYGDAVGSCRSGYHLCSQTELNAGGYQVARAMGWGDAHTQIWANSGNSNPPAGQRLAMCCGGL